MRERNWYREQGTGKVRVWKRGENELECDIVRKWVSVSERKWLSEWRKGKWVEEWKSEKRCVGNWLRGEIKLQSEKVNELLKKLMKEKNDTFPGRKKNMDLQSTFIKTNWQPNVERHPGNASPCKTNNLTLS